ncbi:MAG: TIGR04086 family membrane protein [Desulfitobacterium sp.]|nr:TIGR04086 family membrane protein [Desulfitobacterium sp.]
MGDTILKGISVALLVTVITMVTGLVVSSMEWNGISTSTIVDIGLVISCFAAGFVSSRESGNWILGGIASLGYVSLCLVLIAIFLELRMWGVVQVLAEGILIGGLAGVFGASSSGNKRSRGIGSGQFFAASLWGEPYGGESYGRDFYGRDPYGREPYGRDPYENGERDPHEDAWAELLASDTTEIYEDYGKKEDYRKKEEVERTRKKGPLGFWGKGKEEKKKDKDEFEDEFWESWLEKEQEKERTTKSKAWWEEDAL